MLFPRDQRVTGHGRFVLITQGSSVHPSTQNRRVVLLVGTADGGRRAQGPRFRDRTRCDDGGDHELRENSASQVAPGRGTGQGSWGNHCPWARPLKAETRVGASRGAKGSSFVSTPPELLQRFETRGDCSSPR